MKEKRIIYFLMIFTVFVTFLTIYEMNRISKKDKNERAKIKINLPKEEIPTISVIMGGDVLIHGNIYTRAYKDGKYNFYQYLKEMKPLIKKFDIAYYNQESILGGKELGLSTYPRFNSPYEVGDTLIDLGFNMVSLANNHTLDKGQKGIINSYNYWSKKENVLSHGSSVKEEKPKIFRKNNISYSLLSYTTLTNGLKRKNKYDVNIYNEEEVKKDIKYLKDQKVDFIIVAIHWGEEYVQENESQKRIAKFLAKEKVDLVIGTHPHVIQTVEKIDDTLILYSLGNLYSGQIGDDRQTGVLFSLKFNKKTKEFSDLEAHLTYTENNLKSIDFHLLKNIDEKIFKNKEKQTKKITKILNKHIKVEVK